MEEEAKKFWQNLSQECRIRIFEHSEFDEVYDDPKQGTYDLKVLKHVALKDWYELFDEYQDFIAEVYLHPEMLNYHTRADNWNELSNKEKEERLSGKEIETPGFIDLNKVSLDDLIKLLDEKYMFLSSWEAYVINKLITFYKEHNK